MSAMNKRRTWLKLAKVLEANLLELHAIASEMNTYNTILWIEVSYHRLRVVLALGAIPGDYSNWNTYIENSHWDLCQRIQFARCCINDFIFARLVVDNSESSILAASCIFPIHFK